MTPERVRDPRAESIYRAVREVDGLPLGDAGRFIVVYWPHLFTFGHRTGNRDACAWCPAPRVGPAHPEEV